jgi:hypothetical protein
MADIASLRALFAEVGEFDAVANANPGTGRIIKLHKTNG